MVKKILFALTILLFCLFVTANSTKHVEAQTTTSTITSSILYSSDDANETTSGVDTSYISLWLGSDTSSYAGMRFTNLAIPKGANILSAHIEVYAKGDWIQNAYTITADAVGNSATFSPVAKISTRPTTTATVFHSDNVPWNANTWQSTEELGSVIQEVVNRSDWTPGNSMSIIFHGAGGGPKYVTSNDGDPNLAPKLIVTYSGSALTGTPTPTPGPIGQVNPLPLISRQIPVYASSGTPTNANDNFYNSYWNGVAPAWLSFDLSSIPVRNRGKILFAWYNDPLSYPYETNVGVSPPQNILKDYTIEGNQAVGGTSQSPSTGWVTLTSVTGNVYHSRQHLIDLTGYNWVRLSVSATDGGTVAGVNVDLHDASLGTQDDWLFIGDSITSWGMHHATENAEGNFAQQINGVNRSYFPVYEDAGVGGYNSGSVAPKINTWLALFPGKYVAINLGTNDALNCYDPTTYFYKNMEIMVKAILAAGKIPVIPTINYSTQSAIQTCGPSINTKIYELYTAYPQIIKGPDFWTFFENNQDLIADTLHPNSAGYGAMRTMWRDEMITKVYAIGISPTLTVSPSPLVKNGDTNGDGIVNALDLKNVLQNFLQSNSTNLDQYSDGKINTLDFIRVLKQMSP